MVDHPVEDEYFPQVTRNGLTTYRLGPNLLTMIKYRQKEISGRTFQASIKSPEHWKSIQTAKLLDHEGTHSKT
jgi:hypothetical protein